MRKHLSAAIIAVTLCGQTPSDFAQNRAGVWLDVPFVLQPKQGCGAAVISMVMQYWRQKEAREFRASSDTAAIQSALYSSQAGGIPASAMEKYFQKAGFRTFAIRGGWDDLKLHLSKGRPIIVSLRASGESGPLHYVVVAGLDWERGAVFVNDPAGEKLERISRAAFEAEWKAAGNWALLALPWQGE